ncbi:transcription factor bHLH113 isoform X2 [Cicer arietinum]|uniref:Transcription factor bHLH113 isoform X2 n=1 Tax=Cicer arietinum TaxID=3827 RepID=A0A1S2Y0N5_CICAR|nr:transcription factor bHLH113 isoform X2 [Cicer arietinum]
MESKEQLVEVDHLTTPTTGTSFSQLLLADDNDDENQQNALGLSTTVDQTTFSTPLFSIHNTPKMLCFGNYHPNESDFLLSETNITPPQKSVITSSDSSSASSCNHTNTTFNSLTTKSNCLQKKRNGSGGQEISTKAGVEGQRGPKKTKAENPISTGHAKKKEKLGERIAALQQLVSPFGKTDTASVLHEATGYIRFLHDQVQVLCSPYLQPSQHLQFQHQHGDGDNNGEEVNKDLRSRGLCLIPVGCTLHVASSNGADFWSPASIGNNVSPSPIAKQ